MTDVFYDYRLSRGDETLPPYDQLVALVYAIVLRVVQDGNLAEDVTRTTLLEAWRTADAADDSLLNSAGIWMLSLAHQRAVDQILTLPGVADHTEARSATDRPVVSGASRNERGWADVLDGLTCPQRQTLVSAFFGGGHQDLGAA